MGQKQRRLAKGQRQRAAKQRQRRIGHPKEAGPQRHRQPLTAGRGNLRDQHRGGHDDGQMGHALGHAQRQHDRQRQHQRFQRRKARTRHQRPQQNPAIAQTFHKDTGRCAEYQPRKAHDRDQKAQHRWPCRSVSLGHQIKGNRHLAELSSGAKASPPQDKHK
ncbi:MAG: hypothetical protein A2X69_04080 [Rhodobacteraceae bacterium GWF1_65_7]|nr:MAG: hypothetical protein A2X69_04080 [Rhodobacteraceae bacterium GWF1_65_7]